MISYFANHVNISPDRKSWQVQIVEYVCFIFRRITGVVNPTFLLERIEYDKFR
jgi:hypothetical protein